MLDVLDRFLRGILDIARVNPLAAVVILFIVSVTGLGVLSYLFFKEKKQRKKKEGNFIYTSGLLNNLEINIRKMFDEVKDLMEKHPECYFIGDAGEAKRKALYTIENELEIVKRDVEDLKQFLIIRRQG